MADNASQWGKPSQTTKNSNILVTDIVHNKRYIEQYFNSNHPYHTSRNTFLSVLWSFMDSYQDHGLDSQVLGPRLKSQVLGLRGKVSSLLTTMFFVPTNLWFSSIKLSIFFSKENLSHLSTPITSNWDILQTTQPAIHKPYNYARLNFKKNGGRKR